MDPFAYERINETTWMYVSSFLILSFFFKFNRAWSIRNLDLFLIILLAPGLLLIQSGRLEHSQYLQKTMQQPTPQQLPASQSMPIAVVSLATQGGLSTSLYRQRSEADNDQSVATSDFNQPGMSRQRYGYYWMFGIGGLIMVRMLLDPLLERRPVLEPNLSIGGMVFVGLSLLIFVLANVATYSPSYQEIDGAVNAEKMLRLEAASDTEDADLIQRGPGLRLLFMLAMLSTYDGELVDGELSPDSNLDRFVVAAKTVAITSQVLIVLGLILFCHYHYSNFHMGVGIATIYMMMPYTVIFTGNVLHTIPAALLIWALVCYRVPLAAGIFLGLATGVSYYPLFLLALWISFYWERGWRPFLFGFFLSIIVCICVLFFTSADSVDFVRQLQAMFAFWFPLMENLEGIWSLGISHIWRLPLLIGFVALSVSFAFWPTEKNIGTLIAYTAVLMVAVQYWHGFGGGLYVAWYLPLALMVMFRPNVVGRVAKTEINARWRRSVPEAVCLAHYHCFSPLSQSAGRNFWRNWIDPNVGAHFKTCRRSDPRKDLHKPRLFIHLRKRRQMKQHVVSRLVEYRFETQNLLFR